MDYGDIVEYIDYIKESDPSVRNHELLQIRDLIDNQAIELKDITHDFGIYEFYFPYQTEEWIYVFVKYKDMITIIKDDFFDEQSLVKQTEFLIRFCNEHPDIPISYFSTFMKHVVEIYEWNRSYADETEGMHPADLKSLREEKRKLLPACQQGG